MKMSVAGWSARVGSGFLLLRYEDMSAFPARELDKVASFFNQ